MKIVYFKIEALESEEGNFLVFKTGEDRPNLQVKDSINLGAFTPIEIARRVQGWHEEASLFTLLPTAV